MQKNKGFSILLYLFILFSTLCVFVSFMLFFLIPSLVAYIRYTGILATHEQILIGLITIIDIFFALLFAKWLTIWFLESNNRVEKTLFIASAIFSQIFLLWYWFAPTVLTNPINISSTNGYFHGGMYPDRAKLIALKQEGYTDIISLLDPLALPKEPFLIDREKKAANDLNINLIQIPMLPRNKKDPAAEKRIKALAKAPEEHMYYVHAAFDEGRIKQFMELVDQEEQTTLNHINTKNRASTKYEFSNDIAIEIDKNLIIAPQPTNEDLEKFILPRSKTNLNEAINTLVSVNIEEVDSDLQNKLKKTGIKYLAVTLSMDPYDPIKALNLAKKIKQMPKKILLYSYYMPPVSSATTSIVLSYLYDLPVLPINLMANTLIGGQKIDIIAANVATGKRPQSTEFKDYLKSYGVRKIAYIGPCQGTEYQSDSKSALSLNMGWFCFRPGNTEALISALNHDGPWYVYGPEFEQVAKIIKSHMHNKIPYYLYK